MPKFSANLGFLWSELPLPEAIRQASLAGFEAVECHFPYDIDPATVKTALKETGLPMLGINTAMGKQGVDDFGLLAQPARQEEAIASIDEALDYATAIGARYIHALAGKTARDPHADAVYRRNLHYACEMAQPLGLEILIEPINLRDVPDYHLHTTDQALRTLQAVGKNNLKVMFDCYHVQIMQGDIMQELKRCLPSIGHIQFASVPDRHEPSNGELHYRNIFAYLDKLGWQGYLGAEYRPQKATEDGLSWLRSWQRSSS